MKALEKAIAHREAQAAHVEMLKGKPGQPAALVRSAKRILAVLTLRVEHYKAGGKEATFNPSQESVEALAAGY